MFANLPGKNWLDKITYFTLMDQNGPDDTILSYNDLARINGCTPQEARESVGNLIELGELELLDASAMFKWAKPREDDDEFSTMRQFHLV